MVISSFCATLQSAATQKLKSIKVTKNKKVLQLCTLLFDLGYISGYTTLDKQKLLVFLKYSNGRGPLRGLKVFSRPSSKVTYLRKNVFGRRVNNHYNTNSFVILSTGLGLKTDIECFMFRLGGEPLCVVS